MTGKVLRIMCVSCRNVRRRLLLGLLCRCCTDQIASLRMENHDSFKQANEKAGIY